jgi:hypothetical protein
MSGAPKGNKNHLKHGLYARHYTEAERTELEKAPALEALDEITMLRSSLDHILALIEDCDDPDRKVRLYNSLFTGTQRLLAAMRTHTVLVGDNQELLTTFWEAVELYRKKHNL